MGLSVKIASIVATHHTAPGVEPGAVWWWGCHSGGWGETPAGLLRLGQGRPLALPSGCARPLAIDHTQCRTAPPRIRQPRPTGGGNLSLAVHR